MGAESPFQAQPLLSARALLADLPNSDDPIVGTGGQNLTVMADSGALDLVSAMKALVGREEPLLVVAEEPQAAVGKAPGDVLAVGHRLEQAIRSGDENFLVEAHDLRYRQCRGPELVGRELPAVPERMRRRLPV